MIYDRGKATKAIKELTDGKFAELLARNYMFKGTTDDMDDALRFCYHTDNNGAMIKPTNEDLFNKLIKSVRSVGILCEDAVYYDDHTYVYINPDMAFVCHTSAEEYNIITLTE